jgi:transmembrane protein EpsG
LILQSLNLLRNILAVWISMYAFFFIKQKKYFTSLLIMLISVTFHYSAVICLPVYFILRLFVRKKFLVKKIVLLIVFAIPSLLILSVVIKIIITTYFGRYAHYVKGTNNFVGTGLTINTFLFYFFIAVLCVLKWNKLVKHNEYNKIMFTILMTGFLWS